MMLGKKVTIIGGSGGMGKVFGQYFKKHGFEITLHARNLETLKRVAEELQVDYDTQLENSVKNADIVMVSTPIVSTPQVINKIGPFLKEDALIFDITSLKHEVFKSLNNIASNYPVNSLSLHPMFGPGIKNFRNYVMIFLRVGGTSNYETIVNEFLNMLESDGILLTETTPEEHDLRMALTLGVPHMLNILFLNLLKRSNKPLNELTKFTGTTFLLQKVFAESIIQREMEMFGEIQIENEEFIKVLNNFEMLIKEYKTVIANKDLEEFKRIFTEGLEYSREDNHFKNSYKYFYQFMKILKDNTDN